MAVGRIGATGGFAVARYNIDGSPDTTFSGDGKVITQINGGGSASAVAIQADGKIVVVSGVKPFHRAGYRLVCNSAIQRNGSLDTPSAAATVLSVGNRAFFRDVIVQTDGRS